MLAISWALTIRLIEAFSTTPGTCSEGDAVRLRLGGDHPVDAVALDRTGQIALTRI